MDFLYDIWTLDDYRAGRGAIGKPVMDGLVTLAAIRRS
jgi:hypothetical protein